MGIPGSLPDALGSQKLDSLGSDFREQEARKNTCSGVRQTRFKSGSAID